MCVDSRADLLLPLSQAIAARVGRQPGRLARVAHYAREIALALSWSESRLSGLQMASILVDAGELAVPAWARAAQWMDHAPIGAAIAGQMSCVEAAAMVRSHHECWDGAGYPDGLRGEAIPEGSRILAVADCLAVLPFPEALEALRRGAGGAFDPRIVAVAECHVFSEVPNPDAADWLEPFLVAARTDRLLQEVAGALGDSLRLVETLGELDARLRHLVPYDSMALWRPQEDHLAAAYVSGVESRWLCSLLVPFGGGVSGRAAQSLQSVCREDQGEEDEAPLRSALAIPLEHDGGLVGVLAFYHRDAGVFRKDDLNILLHIREKLAAAVDHAMQYESLEKLSTEDAATGLPNERALFLRLDAELARCRRNRGTLAVLVCEVEGAQWVRRQSVPLQAVADGLRRLFREEDCVARMGDRFVLVLGSFAQRHLPEKRKRLEGLLAQLGMKEVKIGASFYPDDGSYAEDLLAAAEARMDALVAEDSA